MIPRMLGYLFILILFSCTHKQIEGKNLAALGFYASSDKIISELETDDPTYAEHYLLGRAYLKKNEHKKALYHFINSAFVYHRAKNIRLFPNPIYKVLNEFHIKSDYYDDAVFAIAKILYSYREFEYVVKCADLVDKKNTALFREMLILKAKALSELNRHSDAIDALRDGISLFNEKSSKSILLVRLASTYSAEAKPHDALKEYFNAIEINPSHWHSAVAAEQILNIIKNNNISLEKNKKFTLAKALYYAKKYEDALNFLSESISEKSASDESIELYLKTLIRLNKIDVAEKIISKEKTNTKYFKLLRLVADELWDAGNHAVAASRYRILINSSDDIAQHAHFRLCVHSEKHKLPNFENYLRSYISRFPNDENSSYISWLLARAFIRKGDFLSAKPVIEKSLAEQPDGKYSDHLRFWLYRFYMAVAKKEEALNILADMVEKNPDSSYTWSALEMESKNKSISELMSLFESCTSDKCRLLNHALLAVKDFDINNIIARRKKYFLGNREPYIKIEAAIASLDLRSDYHAHLKSLKKYFVVGDAESIFREVSFFPEEDDIKNDIHTAIAHFSDKYGFYHRSAFSTIQLFKSAKISPNFFLMEPKTIERLYPLAYYECVKRASEKYNFDIPTLYAIIRAESLYNHEALSPAGAVGLMQIMPTTARQIAKELSLENYNLKDPCTSIEMGAHYFNKLKKIYKGQLEIMIAAYNAGPTNVTKWMERFPTEDIHIFIEQVPFDETRYYMLRAKKNYLQGKIAYHMK